MFWRCSGGAKSKDTTKQLDVLRSTIGRVMRFAVANGWAERDPIADFKGALIVPNVRHRAAEIARRTHARHLFLGNRPADHNRSVEADGRSLPFGPVKSGLHEVRRCH